MKPEDEYDKKLFDFEINKWNLDSDIDKGLSPLSDPQLGCHVQNQIAEPAKINAKPNWYIDNQNSNQIQQPKPKYIAGGIQVQSYNDIQQVYKPNKAQSQVSNYSMHKSVIDLDSQKENNPCMRNMEANKVNGNLGFSDSW